MTLLRKLRGETGLNIQQIKDYPGGCVTINTGKTRCIKPWRMPAAGESILILSDLGLLDTDDTTYQQWLSFARKLKASGCTAMVLTPLPTRFMTVEVVSLFRVIHWDKGSHLQIITRAPESQQAKRAIQAARTKIKQSLLPWLSAALLIEPELLRAVCRLLSAHEQQDYDAGIEALCWTHADVESNTLGFHIQHDKIEFYRNRLTELANQQPDLAQQMLTLFKIHHQHKYPTEFHEEINVWANSGGIQPDLVTREAETHLKQLVRALYEQQHSSAINTSALQHYSYYFLDRQTQRSKQQQDYLSSLWAILKNQLDLDKPRPQWLNNTMAVPFLSENSMNPVHWLAIQQGETLCLTTPAMQNKEQSHGFTLQQTPLFTFSTSTSLFIEERKDAQGQWQVFDHQLNEQKSLCLPLYAGPRRFHANGKVYTLSELTLPNWATRLGRDARGFYLYYLWQGKTHGSYWIPPTMENPGRWDGMLFKKDGYGFYANLEINGISQGFRWIEPGTFMMGSPKDEPERYDDETQHQVTLTHGYWLADSTVTQALWQAVMGNNPGRFTNNPNNPVEQISWDDTQEFINKLNALIPDIQARLPTEAQWEYACRAGTQTPFSLGENINPEQVNYNGNHSYPGGKKGQYRKETVPVKSLPANRWGLYEMHGNVWEWCEDVWQDNLGIASVTDPGKDQSQSKAGARRVVRGGSWGDDGGDCRSAFRYRNEPDFRDDDVGLRLALGHAELQPSQDGGAVKENKSRPSIRPDRRVAEQRQAGLIDGLRQQVKNIFGKKE